MPNKRVLKYQEARNAAASVSLVVKHDFNDYGLFKIDKG